MRPDYCPIGEEPCQSMCDKPCSAHRLKINPQQAEPVQEPVAWNWMQEGSPCSPAYYGNPPDVDVQELASRNGKTVRLFYTAPPQRKPLSDDEIRKLLSWAYNDTTGRQTLIVFARAIEAAHGIKEET